MISERGRGEEGGGLQEGGMGLGEKQKRSGGVCRLRVVVSPCNMLKFQQEEILEYICLFQLEMLFLQLPKNLQIKKRVQFFFLVCQLDAGVADNLCTPFL